MQRRCWKCHEIFQYENKDTYIDSRGSNYDAKIAKCPHCGSLNVVRYYTEWNRDKWFYEYKETEWQVL